MNDIHKARLRCLVLAEGDVAEANRLFEWVVTGTCDDPKPGSVYDIIVYRQIVHNDLESGLSTDGDTAKPEDPYFKPLKTKK